MNQLMRIEALLENTLKAMGYEIVRLQLSRAKRPILQVMIDRLDQAPLNIDDCSRASHTISDLLDVEDPMVGSYTLEVCSPGLDRPLTKKHHYEKVIGARVKIELQTPKQSRKRYVGKLTEVKDQTVVLHVAAPQNDEQDIEFPFEEISRASVVPFEEKASPRGKSKSH